MLELIHIHHSTFYIHHFLHFPPSFLGVCLGVLGDSVACGERLEPLPLFARFRSILYDLQFRFLAQIEEREWLMFLIIGL
jgi:hypothetical protein